MLFSVIIPVYKTPKDMIEKALDSVYKQSFDSYEIIVVDDNPRDSEWKKESRKLSLCYTKNILWIFHEDNKGANAARNTGILNAKGDIIAFLDADDEWEESYLEEVGKTYKDKSIIITACEVLRIYSNRVEYKKITQSDGNIYDNLLYGDIVGPTSAVTVRIEELKMSGMFDENLPARQDYDLWLRVCSLGNISYIKEPLVVLHCDENRERISKGLTNHERGTLMVLEKILSNVRDSNKAREIKFSHYKYLGWTCMKENEYDKARRYYQLCLHLKKSIIIYIFYLLSYFPFLEKCIRKMGRLIRNYAASYDKNHKDLIYKYKR